MEKELIKWFGNFCKQDKAREGGLGSLIQTQIWNVIIAIKRDICQKTAGGKEAARKVKDLKARKDLNQAQDTNLDLNEVLYMAYGTEEISKHIGYSTVVLHHTFVHSKMHSLIISHYTIWP